MVGEELYKGVLLNLSNLYDDNYDHYRYGKLPFKQRLGFWVLKIFKKLNLVYFTGGKYNLTNRINKISDRIEGLDFLYSRLNDDHSRQLLIQVLLFRILGNYRYKLKLDLPDYHESIATVNSLKISSESVEAIGAERVEKFIKYDLNPIGFDIKMFGLPKGMVSDFIWKQYEYNHGGIEIKASFGDVVIDAGGCYGDTALYFSAVVGQNGKVYSFEFIPNNIKFFQLNLNLNPDLRSRIQLVDKPLWSNVNTPVYYKDSGPGSRVSFDRFEGCSETSTNTIDFLVQLEKLTKVDFIKMDIEGAELHALDGAAESIRKFKPKLAISVYHSLADFGDIPKKILELNPAYQLYLGHYTINAEETVLFAVNTDAK